MSYADAYVLLLGGLLAGVVLVAIVGRLCDADLGWPRGTRLLPGLALIAAIQAFFPWVFPAAVRDVMPDFENTLWLASLTMAVPVGALLLRLGTLGSFSAWAARGVAAVQAGVAIGFWLGQL